MPAGTAVFVGEYGIDLLDGTVFRRRWMLPPGLMERVSELEAPSVATQAPGTVEAEPEGAEPRSDASGAQEGAEHQASTLRDWSGDVEGRRRPWWRRLFGG